MSLVDNAKSQDRKKGLGEYFESHHVLPRSMGGDNKKSNIVLLTPKEHFVAHHLLCKMHQTKSMKIAFWMMCHTSKSGTKRDIRITSSVYEKSRADFSILAASIFSKANKGRKLSQEQIEKLAAHRSDKFTTKGFRHSDESKKKIAAASTGRKRTKESIAKSTANRDYTMSEETRAKLKGLRLGIKHTQETRKKMSEAHKGYVKSQEHCERLRQSGIANSHRRGLRWFTNGVDSIMAKECPEGYSIGRTLRGAVAEV
jgi:hypothetical protein